MNHSLFPNSNRSLLNVLRAAVHVPRDVVSSRSHPTRRLSPCPSGHAAAAFRLAALVLALSAFVPRSSFGCSICGCSLGSDWAALGYESALGTDLGVRFEYIDQRQLREGTHVVDRTPIEIPSEEERQQRTLNRTTWLDLDHTFNSHWGATAQLPFYNRFHTTIAEDETEISSSHARGLGDLRLLGRYQNGTSRSQIVVQFGLKLPTGRFDQNFQDGPIAGEHLDRGLQLGTGTTDLLTGAGWFFRPAAAVGAFVQGVVDQPLAARDGFLPSSAVNFNCGLRWLNSSRVTPQLQLNTRWESREHGSEADTPNSGGVFVHVSPGLTAELTSRTRAFVFVQLPVYQRVNGQQLEPYWILSVGLHCRL